MMDGTEIQKWQRLIREVILAQHVQDYIVRLVLATHPEAPSMIEIEVRDEGRGISPQALRQVFDPFFSTRISGSGLGLSVARRIVQDHGGEISVESQPGEGTTFVLLFPMRPAKEPEETGEAENEE